MATEDLEWERSNISNQDMNLLKKLGFTKKENSLRFPKEESYPTPPIEYRVSFVDHLIRGLSPPIHVFLRGLLFVYGLQLHQLTPNSILHVSIFITLWECFLGVQPNWAMWKRIFCLRRNGSHNVAYDIGGVVNCVRSNVEYFDVKFPDSVQGWRKRWLGDEEEAQPIDATARTSTSRTLVVSEAQADGDESSPPQQNTEQPTPPASPRAPSPKRARVKSITEPALQLGDSTTPLLDNPLIKEFIRFDTQFVGYGDHANIAEENLAEANKRADALARKLEQSEKARKKAEADAKKAKADAAAVEDLQKRLHDAETALSNNVAEQAAHEKEILSRLQSQSRCFGELIKNTKWRILKAISLSTRFLLEIHGDEAREGLADARSRLFPYFFPKKVEPNTFTALAKSFNVPEDLGLKLRQEGLKIGVESTIALIADSQQNVDWVKVGDIKEMETKKWQSLTRATKPPSKPILAFLGVKPTPAPSASNRS
ncbi:hypothetical protein QYE76_012297 [Lolium multiflorum]|uniref:Transposase (putative) gypsy type domain-containing protein n=1 Tax=Lolium multiflorum TaxID=4521 RepID=A0AAD8X4U3_LOLMU|nr:hypothetical protein QYE76_012297 [Lolium multiflorum]